MASTQPKRIFVYAGPGDVLGTFAHWQRGADDPNEVAQTYSSQLFDALVAEDWEAWIVAASEREAPVLRDGRFTIEHRAFHGERSRGLRYLIARLRYSAGLLRDVLRYRADAYLLVTGTQWWVACLARLLGVRVVTSIHCVLWASGSRPRSLKRRLLLWLDGWVWRRAAFATICVSPDCERQVRALAPLPAGPIVQVRAQYPREEFAELPPPAASGPFRALFAGRIEAGKGVFELLDVASMLAAQRPGRFAFEICGAGGDSGRLERAVARRGLGGLVALRGKLRRDEMRDAYARAHAVVVPTTARFLEGLNKVAVEGVLAGRPVVATRFSNATDVLGDAIVPVESGDASSFARALCALADDPDAYDARRKACADVAAQFHDPRRSWGHALQRILASCRAELDSGAGRGATPGSRAPSIRLERRDAEPASR